MNFTVSVPVGTQNHGDENLLCLPPKWTDYLTFFATNYFAHAATVVPRQGQTSLEGIIDTVNALFVPGSGILRAMRFLFFQSVINWRQTPLEKAAKAGALCMVVKKSNLDRARNFQAPTDEEASWFSDAFFLLGDPEYVPSNRAILGICDLQSSRFCLIEVPPQAFLDPYSPEQSNSTSSSPEAYQIPGSRDIPKILISIVQIIWGVITLYQAQGNQIDLYGYGAFGLTVIPYAFMSLVNLIVNILRPTYSNLYLVHTPDQDECPGRFYGMVASINLDLHRDQGRMIINPAWATPKGALIYAACYLSIIVIPLAVVGGFTGFRTGTDVTAQRSWILAWMIVGSASSLYVRYFSSSIEYGFGFRKVGASPLVGLIVSLPLWIPTIGGMIVVGRMLGDFGICTKIDPD